LLIVPTPRGELILNWLKGLSEAGDVPVAEYGENSGKNTAFLFFRRWPCADSPSIEPAPGQLWVWRSPLRTSAIYAC